MLYPFALPRPWLRSLPLFGGLWLLAFLSAAAQPDAAAVRIERLPAAGLLLSKGWRYHAGDNPAWARPDFDDSQWDTISPAKSRRTQPRAVQAGISWLRLHLRLSADLRQRQLLLLSDRLPAAWELYFNGRMMQRSGALLAGLARGQANGSLPEVAEVPGTGTELVLAVRYAPSCSPSLPGIDNVELLKLHLLSRQQVRQRELDSAAQDIIFCITSSLFALLTLLHLAFFYYNPARRANLYFSVYALSLSLGALGLYYQARLPFATLSSYLIFEAVADVGLTWLSGVWAIRALYSLFGFRPGWLYTAIWLSSGVLVVLSAFLMFTSSAIYVYLIGSALLTLEQLRLTGQAVYQRRRGSTIISIGFAAALLDVLGMVSVKMAGIELSPVNSSLTYPLFVLPPALAISLFLAREFALDAELLQVKLSEVERLSVQTLAQEQEKQALLAQQNETLETQVQQRTGELQRSLTDLRATQTQLIQKEKMASLGELTAGIAHEIQNPLNFVNNFADVSIELLDELAEEQARPSPDTELAAELVGDLRRNLTKISQHGQRAASIVRSMLEHSRRSTGERAPVDVNALAAEYLRLAYHGLRARDKTFNAELETDFAPSLPLVEGVGADLGRVLLNLFNNAFYAMQKRQQVGEPGYAPRVRVSTKHVGRTVELQVIDNGTGMSVEIQQKIFQPFFTTKPAGEGTGLGLSLAHDIITQGHSGSLHVESQVGKGSTFHVSLPTLQ